MKKKLLWIIPVAVLLIAALVVGIWFWMNQESEKTIVTESGDIFYKNELLTVGADPDVIYISEGEDAGYYYMYITSDDLHGAGFLAYKSRDLVEWVCAGVALRSGGAYDETTGYTTVSYAFSNYWAPEVIYDAETKLYYMFYTANRYDTSFESDLYFFGDIAVSESPAGPFVQYNKYIGKEPVVIDEKQKIMAYEPVFDFSKMDPAHPLYETESNGYMKVIDMNPFIDPVSGKKYVYFCHDLSKQQAISQSNIYVMALQDDYMPDYTNIQALTSPNCLELDGMENTTLNEGSTNEAPYVIYNEQSGKYYLLFSANAYYQKTYCVRVAVGDSPEGPFRKLTQKEGGFLLYADSHWTWASGTGHCSVVNRDGQDYIVYHAHLDRVNGNSKRGIAMDELNWVENSDGLLVPVANGPSAALMPLTTYLYENVADEAKVSADSIAKGKASALTDGLISHRDNSLVEDVVFDDDTTIELEFKQAKTISGIAVYNSYEYDYLFSTIESIRLHLADGGSALFKDMDFDWDSYYTEEGYVIPGGSVAITFDPVKVTSIEISMPDAGEKYAVSEIAVMARRQDRQELPDIQSDTSWNMEAPADDTVEFDGVVNPEEYKGDKISFADTNGVTMTMYSKMAEDGIFFGFHSNDTNVFVNPEHAIFQNSSVEIQLGKGGSDKLNANVVQLRYGLDGSIEGWIGVNSTENYQYMRTYIESVSKVHIYGQLNSSECTGYDVEAYVPYSALNMTEKPESLICAPSFNTRKDFDASGRTTWTLMVGSSFQDPTSWYRIDAQGQTVMTDGFRVQDNQITQTGGSNQFYYFDDEVSDAYYVNVDVKVGDILNGDRYPKFGVVSKSLDSLLAYYVDYAGGNVNGIGRVTAHTTEFIGTAWGWENGSSKTFGTRPCVGLDGDGTINLELIRYENQIIMLVNGRMVMSDVDVKGLQDGSIPGLFFFNTTADITVNAYQTDKQLVQYYMANYQPEIAIDGDLGDWEAKTQLATETDSVSGNAMTVYGYQTPAGVYLAYEVKHGYQPKVYMWNEGQDERGVWYYNTNAEFGINDLHFAATAFGDSGYMVKSMVTTEDLVTGTFTTVTEVFVPREVIGSGDAAVGFAFKTCDKDYSDPSQITDPKMKFRGDPWWCFKGHFPTDMAQRFILKNVPAETTTPSQQTGTYKIQVLPTANGVVTLSATEAQAGQTITLTLTPDKGYELVSLTANGKPCESQLVMPGEDLYIVARFGLPDIKTPETVYPQGTFFGSAGDCHSSDVLNMTTDSGTNPYLVMDAQKGTPLFAYVKDTTAKQFYLELTAQVTGIRGDEKYPKFGFMTNDGKEMVKIYLDMSTNKVVGGVGAVHQQNGKGDDWAGQSTWILNKKLDLSAKKVTLGLLRNGATYYCYVNGVLVATSSDLSNLNTAMGIFSFGTSLKVTDYKLVKTGTTYNDLLTKAKADAKAFQGAALTQNYFTKTLNGAYLLSTNSDAQHLVDDVTAAGKVMRERYYSLKGKLTLSNAETWGQARVLISADPKNEYFIALEKVGDKSYQIFTMHKSGEDGWDHWLLVESAEVNGNRNSIDFEVLVIDNHLYFLIDNQICYESQSVPMKESSVKFTGFNVGTTKVENLSLRVFADKSAATSYAKTKTYNPNRAPIGNPEGEFFGTAGDYTSSNVLDMSTDKGQNGYLVMDADKATPLFAYVKDLNANRFYLEAEMQITGIRADETYPKFGFMTNDGKEMVKFYLDMNQDRQVGTIGAVHQIAGGEDDWAGQSTWTLNKKLDLSAQKVKLGLLRDGDTYYFYVDGVLVATGSDLSDLNTAMGIFSFGTSMKVTNYKLVKSGVTYNGLLIKAKADAVTFKGAALTQNYFTQTQDGVYQLTTNSDAQHLVDDLTSAGKILQERYYSVKGKLTLTDADTWGQARVLISADPKNEYVIALEKTGEDSYQIFTMHKSDEEGWDHWLLVESAEVNGNRNSLDFEVLVIEDHLYFLVDDQIYYESQSVSMPQSSVKFTGYNVATTTVENLSVTLFDNKDAAAAYASTKTHKPSEPEIVYPEGEFFGTADGYTSSLALDMTTDKAQNGYLVMDTDKATPLYAYVKDLKANRFYVETVMQVTGIRADESYPKFGFMTNDGTEMVKFYLDMTTDCQVNTIGAVHQIAGGEDDWAGQNRWNMDQKLDLTEGTVKLAILRDGKNYYFYINDQLEGYGNDLSELDAAVGMFSFGTSLKLTDYRVVTQGSEMDALLAKTQEDMAALQKVGLTTNYFTQLDSGIYTLTTDSDAQHLIDDVKIGKTVLKEAYYALSGKLTLTDADTWGQARILISTDPMNEHFIALEKTGENSYQIFTMSKANEEGWTDWRLIAHGDVNGNQNSLDFQVIVDRDTLYFLVDDAICYTSDRVSMTESTVKFTGYNVGTTQVENLSVQTFADSAELQAYLATKSQVDYVSRFQSRMDSLYNEYITEHGCTGKGGTLILGDSYMDFWGAWESQTGLAKYVNGYNVGIGGSAIRDWLLAYDQLVKPFGAERIIINIGYNDVNVWGDNGQEFAANLETLLEKIHADFPETEIYYIYINPSPSVYANGAYTNKKIEDAIKLSKELIAGLDYVTGVDLFDLMTTEDGKNPVAAYYVGDNIHLSDAGYKVLSGHLYDLIFRGETFGAAGGYTTSNGVDLSADQGENPSIQVFGGAPQYAYAHGVYGDQYSFETEINVQSVLNNDAWPKFGLLVNGSSEMVKFFVDMNPQLTATQVGVVYQPTGGGDDWAGSKSYEVPGMSFAGSDTIRLKLVRDGRAYYFFVNDTLVMYNEYGFQDTEGAVGIFSFNTVLTASKYQVAAGENAQTQIAEAKAAAALLTKLSLTCNWFADQGDGKFTLTTNSNAEHMVDDLTRGGQVLRAKYYSVKGKLTLANAGDWGQARILISADAKNEYFIALEKTNTGKYQIFTMSKANQTGWDAWELILHQDTNGTRNSIDFEVLVMSNKLYFLIDDQVVYTKTRVPMTESTVKFTGYNTATTIVENLSVEIFADQQAANAYLSEKN